MSHCVGRSRDLERVKAYQSQYFGPRMGFQISVEIEMLREVKYEREWVPWGVIYPDE